jgi:hypothetical protein
MTNGPTGEDQIKLESERLIREKAFQLWQADGAPEGRADHYWHLARKLITPALHPLMARPTIIRRAVASHEDALRKRALWTSSSR